jgi:hypothetical protein
MICVNLDIGENYKMVGFRSIWEYPGEENLVQFESFQWNI